MKSAFAKSPVKRVRGKGVGTSTQIDETYDLRGLNLSDPDQITEDGESPLAQNCRMYSRQESEKRVAIRTRKGSRRLSTPVGEVLDAQNISAGTGDLAFTTALWVLEPFVALSTGALTRLDIDMKRTIAGSGHVIIEVFTDVAGVPGTLIAQSSINAGLITSAYADQPVYFIDAPSITVANQYWWRARVERDGTATYAVHSLAGSGGKSTVSPGSALTDLGLLWRYKSYISTTGAIKGYTRRYPSDKTNRTLFAMNNDVYSVTDAGVAASISSTIDTLSTKVRFDQADDKTFWVDGVGTPKKWDGTTVSAVANAPTAPTHLALHQNRMFYVPAADPTRVAFSDLFSFESYPSVNFFYVPNPKSPDWIAALKVFQDNLVIFTRETKHVLYGSDLGSFTRKEAIGTKGAVSQEAVEADRNYIYFMADDKMIYRYNGVEDEFLSAKVEAELRSIPDASKVRLHLYRNQLRVYYPKGTDTQANNMLLLELSNKESNKYLQWFTDTGRPVAGSLEWTQNNNELIEFSSKCGAFYLGEITESDLGKPIQFKYWTKYKAYGSGLVKDRVRKFRPFIRPSSGPYTMSIGKDMDFANRPQMTDYPVVPGGTIWGAFNWNDGSLWGSASQFIDAKVPMSGRGKFTQYRFECGIVESPVELYGYGAVLKSGKAK